MASITVQWLRNTAAFWTAGNYLLLQAQTGYETDTKKWKIGDGVTTWNSLPYAIPTANAVSVALAVQSGAANVVALNFAQPMYQGSIPAATSLTATITRAGGSSASWPVSSLAWSNSTTAVATMASSMTPGDTALMTFAEGNGPRFLTLASNAPLPSFSAALITNNVASLMETTWNGTAARYADTATYTPDVSNAEGSQWVVVNGANIDGAGNLALHPSTNDVIYYPVTSRKNFTFSSQISITGDTAAKILFYVRASNSSNNWLFVLSQTTLTLSRQLAGAFTATNFTSPATASVNTTVIADGAVHQVDIVMGSDDSAVFKIDGTTLATVTINDVVAGKYGVGYFSQGGGSGGLVKIANTKLYY